MNSTKPMKESLDQLCHRALWYLIRLTKWRCCRYHLDSEYVTSSRIHWRLSKSKVIAKFIKMPIFRKLNVFSNDHLLIVLTLIFGTPCIDCLCPVCFCSNALAIYNREKRKTWFKQFSATKEKPSSDLQIMQYILTPWLGLFFKVQCELDLLNNNWEI